MRAEPEHGFTLVEVLVALVVTSILLAILMNGATLARSRDHAADERRDAVLLAPTLLDRAIVEGLSGPATVRGREGKLRWTMERATVASDPRRLVALVAWRVTIFGAAGNRLLTAPTRRLVPVPPS